VDEKPQTVTNADVVDRLARLRAVLPLLAKDLAAARRRSNSLEVENRRLARRVRELESKLAARRPVVSTPPPARRRSQRAATGGW